TSGCVRSAAGAGAGLALFFRNRPNITFSFPPILKPMHRNNLRAAIQSAFLAGFSASITAHAPVTWSFPTATGPPPMRSPEEGPDGHDAERRDRRPRDSPDSARGRRRPAHDRRRSRAAAGIARPAG